MDWFASGSRRTEETNGGLRSTPSVPRSATRRNFFTVYVLCTQARKEESPGSFTHGQTGNMNKEEGNGYPRFFSSSFSSLLLKFSYTSSFRGGGGTGGRKNIMFARFSFPPVFNIFENFLAPLYFLTFIIPLIFIAEPSYFLSFHFKKDYVSLFFYLFFFLLIYHLIVQAFVVFFKKENFLRSGKKLGEKCISVRTYSIRNCK